MKKILLLTLTAICLLAALTACGQKTASKQSETADDPAAEEQTIKGIVNRIDNYLVLLDDNGEYRIFDFGADVDPSALEEGDSVTVTYTGTLDSEDPSPVAVSIQKEE